jgi:hypothetical protein
MVGRSFKAGQQILRLLVQVPLAHTYIVRFIEYKVIQCPYKLPHEELTVVILAQERTIEMEERGVVTSLFSTVFCTHKPHSALGVPIASENIRA